LAGVTEAAKTRRSYDLVAADYASEIGDELRRKPLDRALLNAFTESMVSGAVVDVGCGPGHVTTYLAGRGTQALGLDLSPGMCAAAGRASALPFCAADMTALPIRSRAVAGIVCLYAVIHLDTAHRAAAYSEFARVLRPGGQALIAFHTSDIDVATGGATALTDWWGNKVDLRFRFLDPDVETRALAGAGLKLSARLDRSPYPAVEHASQRTYLIVQSPDRGDS
jgi:SAM-dependent methyltransferase